MFKTAVSATVWACVAGEWKPQIGDPNLTGWLTVISYLICFGLAAVVSARLFANRRRGGFFWVGITVLMLFLAFNKQLDLQSAMTSFGRCLSHAQGWWENRQTVQITFVLGLIMAMSVIMACVLATMRGRIQENLLALVGLGVLCTFVLVRAVGFHNMDSLIRVEVASLSLNFIFENIGLVMIALNAVMLIELTADAKGRREVDQVVRRSP